MAKQANILTDAQHRLAVKTCRNPRELVMLLLSTKAAMRAVEIAGLQWDNVVWGSDDAPSMLRLHKTKGDKFRQLAVHPDLEAALRSYWESIPDHRRTGAVIRNEHKGKGQPMTANAVAAFFCHFYSKRMGLVGYSSHTGRRTATTKMARNVSKAGGSLRDVMAVVGHNDLRTTQRYVDTDPEAQSKLIGML